MFMPLISSDIRVAEFALTNLFKRKADALLRLSYQYDVANTNWNFKPNLLTLYHLGEDSYVNVEKWKL